MSEQNPQEPIQKTPEQLKAEEEERRKRQERAEQTLKDYWYPSETGEQNEVLPSLMKNIKRSSPTTKIIDCFVKSTILLILFVLSRFVLKTILCYYDSSYPLFTEENKLFVIICLTLIFIIIVSFSYYLGRKDPTIYLAGFETAIVPDELIYTNDQFAEYVKEIKIFNEESCAFLKKLVHRAGLGSQTALPPAFHVNPPDDSYEMGRKEFEITVKSSCDQLFEKLKINPEKDIDFVVTNCSMFAPTPSLGALIMNMYKMKQTCKNYSFGGMGCSAGLVSVDLAKDILRCHKNVNVLIYSTESITRGWYGGQERGKLLSNTLFRVGAGAILMSNKSMWKNIAPYKMVTTVRIHHAKYEESYRAIYQSEDNEGIVGVNLSKKLANCVSRALVQNMKILLPQVMSYKEMFKFLIHFIKQKMGKIDKKEEFRPDFRETFQAFCIHAGGRAIIDGIQESMGLTDEDCMPSRATLYRYGNTSSSSIWYEFKFIERCQLLKKGDKVWQIAFGSGLKCNSCVWKKIK